MADQTLAELPAAPALIADPTKVSFYMTLNGVDYQITLEALATAITLIQGLGPVAPAGSGGVGLTNDLSTDGLANH